MPAFKPSKRVVVTGLGLVSPLGVDVDSSWENLLKSHSGIIRLPDTIAGNTPIKIGGLVKNIEEYPELGFDITKYIPYKDQKKSDRFIHFALAAAAESIKQAQLETLNEATKLRTATIIATGIGGVHIIKNIVETVSLQNNIRLSPFTVPSFIGNMAAAHISIKYGFKGMLGTPVTACAASLQAIGDGFKAIHYGEADIAVVGGSESCINPVSLASFHAARALSSHFNDRPQLASRPFDSQRDGFVMGEGAGVIVLEELEHAKRRKAHILAEITGYGTTSDAYHITSGPQDGSGAARAILLSLHNAQLQAHQINYINAHSTSTPIGDLAELNAIKTVFGHDSQVAISSTKSATGHLLGAAGVTGTIFAILAIRDQIAPPSINIERLDPAAIDLNIVKNHAHPMPIEHTLINGFGFGGVNACIVVSRYLP